jgi:hypothetical protein
MVQYPDITYRDVDEKRLAPLRKNDKLQEEFLNRVLEVKARLKPTEADVKVGSLYYPTLL